jgi:hypothetical protein
VSVLALVLALVAPTASLAQGLVPEKRFVMTKDVDLPGGDIASLFDTVLEACQKACATTQSCTAFTFNAVNGACFLKAGPGAPSDYAGAFSGYVVKAAPGAGDVAKTRAAELSFLSPADLSNAYALAERLPARHLTGQWSAQEHLAAAKAEEVQGNVLRAAAFVGAAMNITDAAVDWAEYARLLALAANRNSNTRQEFEERALNATINGYLRAEPPGLRHNLLVAMAEVLEAQGRGQDMVPALRLAQDIQPRSTTEVALDVAIGKYGFRVTEHNVQSDSARPRICAQFSGELAKTGVDFDKFV